LEDFTQAYLPQAEEGEELLLSWAGWHWKPSAEKQQWWVEQVRRTTARKLDSL
jgi:hypothetical protein